MLQNVTTLCIIFIGGGLGACSRWMVDVLIARHLRTSLWPWGTFAVNLSGCLLIGILLALVCKEKNTSGWFWLLASTGFAGSFTTFSTFCMQLFEYYMEKQWGLAILYASVSVIAGFLLVVGGYYVFRTP